MDTKEIKRQREWLSLRSGRDFTHHLDSWNYSADREYHTQRTSPYTQRIMLHSNISAANVQISSRCAESLPHTITFPDGGHIWTQELAKMLTMRSNHLVKCTLRWLHISVDTAGEFVRGEITKAWPSVQSARHPGLSHLDAGCRLVCHVALPQAPLPIVIYSSTRAATSLLFKDLARLSHLPQRRSCDPGPPPLWKDKQ